jgi:hypothetical protein
MPGVEVTAARFATLALAAAALLARFFGDRRFGGGAVRLERGLDAMIPPTRLIQHATACHRESRRWGFFHFALPAQWIYIFIW